MLPKFYYERQKQKRRKMILFSTISALAIGIALFLIWLGFGQTINVLKPQKLTTIQENAILELTTSYACGHSKTERFQLPRQLIGKTAEEAKEIYSEWDFSKITDSMITAQQTQAYECENHFMLVLNQNKITVTNSRDHSKIISELEINPNILTQEDKSILEAGIFINSEYELLEILESFR